MVIAMEQPLLPPYVLAGLRTLLEKADLLARYSEAERCCAELGVENLSDLNMDTVRQKLSEHLSRRVLRVQREPHTE
jgi:predicted component of type VI protein secretion system